MQGLIYITRLVFTTVLDDMDMMQHKCFLFFILDPYLKMSVYACYFCGRGDSSPIALVPHYLKWHSSEKFSLKEQFLCETTGKLKYKSIHFDVPVKELNDLEGVTIDTENYKIRRKRKSVPDNWENDETENSENVDPCIATKLEANLWNFEHKWTKKGFANRVI